MGKIKRCTNCGRFLDAEKEFNWYNKKKGYKQSECKKCHNVNNWILRQLNLEHVRKRERQYWNDNKEYMKGRQKQWCLNNPEYYKHRYENNKEHIKEYYKHYYKTNKGRISKQNKKWHKENKEYRKERSRQYRQENKYHIYEYNKQWRQENKEYCKERDKQYRINNRDKINTYTAKRRATKKNQTPSTADNKKIEYIYYMAQEITKMFGKKYQVDHIVPLSKGGLHHEDNLQILEAALNQEKNDKYPLTALEKTKYCGFTLKILESME
ncbi:hypothetical protein LCGC14_0550360 [marine sediment metagenome]|uniref:HNH nuclease domain-containing protein n=1 Tax=marine sediment metagenome TaxID=412755 RepID=A0A0F9S8L3_9ZZZZ